MNAVRTLVRDLIDRKLWPVALLLVAAAVAIPVLIGRAPAPAPTAAPAPAAPVTGATDAQKAAVSLATAVPAGRDRPGAVRNPFKAPASKKKASTASTSAPAAAGTPSVASGGTSSASPASTASGTSTPTPSTGSDTTTTPSSSGSGSSSKPTTPKTTTAPKADDASDTYHVSLRFGVNGGELKTLRDVARLSALPSVTDPFFVYLGVLETATTHEKRAVFLVSSDATPTGEGACHPTKEDCQSVELAVGQTMFFDLASANGGPGTQYQLELAGIHKTEVSTEAKASAAFARHSAAGAELLSDAAKRNVRAAAGARAYRYIPATGLLARAKRKHVTARAAAAGTMIPGLALVSRKDQPGIPVWHSPKH
jgi:hypothetical protein